MTNITPVSLVALVCYIVGLCLFVVAVFKMRKFYIQRQVAEAGKALEMIRAEVAKEQAKGVTARIPLPLNSPSHLQSTSSTVNSQTIAFIKQEISALEDRMTNRFQGELDAVRNSISLLDEALEILDNRVDLVSYTFTDDTKMTDGKASDSIDPTKPTTSTDSPDIISPSSSNETELSVRKQHDIALANELKSFITPNIYILDSFHRRVHLLAEDDVLGHVVAYVIAVRSEVAAKLAIIGSRAGPMQAAVGGTGYVFGMGNTNPMPGPMPGGLSSGMPGFTFTSPYSPR